MTGLKVLLVGECASPHSQIAQRLASWNAECQFATTYSEASELLKHETFRLVISGPNLRNGSASLIPLLEGFPTTPFCSHSIEDSCLWIRVMRRERFVGMFRLRGQFSVANIVTRGAANENPTKRDHAPRRALG